MTREKFQLYTKLGLMAVTAILVAPIVFLLIKGIVGLAVAVVLVAILNALAPAFSSWLTHIKFQSLKFVIDRAPVDELIQRAKERWDTLGEQRDLLQAQAATLATYKKKVARVIQEYPEEADEQLANLSQYEQLFALRVEAFKTAKLETQKYMRTVDKAESIYDMAVAEAEMGKSFNRNKDFMAIFREKTAFDAVDRASANALAGLKMAIIDNDFADKATTAPPAVTYDRNNEVQLGHVLDLEQKVVSKARPL